MPPPFCGSVCSTRRPRTPSRRAHRHSPTIQSGRLILVPPLLLSDMPLERADQLFQSPIHLLRVSIQLAGRGDDTDRPLRISSTSVWPLLRTAAAVAPSKYTLVFFGFASAPDPSRASASLCVLVSPCRPRQGRAQPILRGPRLRACDHRQRCGRAGGSARDRSEPPR